MPRLVHLLGSILIHLCLFVLWWSGVSHRPASETIDEQETVNTELVTELVTEADLPAPPVVEVSNSEAVVEEEVTLDDEESPRVDFAGAPPKSEAAGADSSLSQDDAGPGPNIAVSSESPDTAEDAMLSPKVDLDGLRAPRVVFTGLSASDMDTMVRAGQGAYLAIMPSAHDGEPGTIFFVRGSVTTPTSVVRAEQADLDRLSERVLPVPRQYLARVRQRLELDFAFSSGDVSQAMITFAISNQLDRRILDQQRNAAKRLSCELEDIDSTVGRLVITNNRAERFRVSLVRLKDGRAVSL